MSDWKEYVYVATNNDGGVSCIYPAPNYHGTEEEWIARHELESMEEYVRLHPVQMPVSREFRANWKLKNGRIIVAQNEEKDYELDRAANE